MRAKFPAPSLAQYLPTGDVRRPRIPVPVMLHGDNRKEVPMVVMVWVSLTARVAAGIGWFVRRRWRLLLLLTGAALLVLPLLRGDVAPFGLNGLGLGFGAMLVRRLLFWCMRRTLRR